MIALLLASGAALAADCVFYGGATLHLPTGPVEGQGVEVQGDEITHVGAAPRSGDCEQVDVSGKVITAGFVDAHTTLGLVEVGMVGDTHDSKRGGPSGRVLDGYNPNSTLIPVTRVAGTTVAVIVPAGGTISAPSAAVSLAGGTQEQALVQEGVAFYGAVGANVGASLDDISSLLDDARHWAKNASAYEQNRTRDYVASARDLEALQPLLRGERPLVLPVDRASDIEAVLRFAEAEQLRVILRGGAEAWMHAEALADARIPVMLDPYVYNPGSFDQVYARPDNAALLHAAGVQVIIASGSAHFARGLRQLAGNAVREGLPHEAGLAAITSAPAEALGLEAQGRLEVGAAANLGIWSGDPLELLTSLERLVVDGEEVTLETRQTQLRDRYQDLPGTPLPPLDLPDSVP